ncbi:Adenylate kinase [Sodalis praecaptivus]|uniref:Adenylate kinase n=1 Tax=Sodalis praecaptivus TaxID=1239307 RepID=W0HXQ9_9GAMM|nr:adenylate kinase [Sodalis praecaptivus]AHF78544.1 Adenylate kinase [Sodalis praecaptivus]
MKINVVGTSGSGKSTFSRRLAAQLAIPYIEMDALFWQPNWTPSSDAAFFARLEQALAQAHWVLDGNYHRSCGIKWRQAQMIVWLDYSLTRTLWQATARAWRRSWRQQEIWPGTGNRESLRRSFLSRESVVLWTLKTYRSNRRRYLAIQQDPRYRHVQFVPLRSPRHAERFLSQLTASVSGQPLSAAADGRDSAAGGETDQ